jgi:hypothetical protein
MLGVLRYAILTVALAGCIPVSYRTSPAAIRDAVPALRREGTAVVPVGVEDDEPAEDSPSASKTEVVRLDQPIRVNVAAFGDQTMTVADLIADCPSNLDNTEANRLAYPRCGLFRAGNIELHHGHRADRLKLVLAGSLVAAAGDVACIAECGHRGAGVATDVGIAGLGAAGAAAALGLFLYEITKDDGPRN